MASDSPEGESTARGLIGKGGASRDSHRRPLAAVCGPAWPGIFTGTAEFPPATNRPGRALPGRRHNGCCPAVTMTPIEIALCLLLLHGALGAFDTFVNHEWREHLPSRPEAATELALHSGRSWAFALMFTGLAWFEWHGLWGWLLLGLVGFE